MHRYIVLDLDGTLAPIGKKASDATARILRHLEKNGRTIVLCSGKPTYYLVGFARQIGLSSPVLIGENGLRLVRGIDLPPAKNYVLPYDRKKDEAIARLRKEIGEKLGDRVWFQPNESALTPFPRDPDCFDEIEKILEHYEKYLEGIRIYRQCDCFDILPSEGSKKEGLSYFAKLEKADSSQFVAVGDGVNDLPMFDFADYSIGIGEKLRGKADRICKNAFEALKYIEENL